LPNEKQRIDAGWHILVFYSAVSAETRKTSWQLGYEDK
jgi:hypothetical protein